MGDFFNFTDCMDCNINDYDDTYSNQYVGEEVMIMLMTMITMTVTNVINMLDVVVILL